MRRIFLKALGTAAAGLLLAGVSTAPAPAEDGVIDAETAHARQQTGEMTVIDIRRPSEWQETGIPAGGKAVTMHDPDGLAAFLSNVLDAVDGNPDAPIGLICASGVRSTWASAFLARNGFTQVYNIKEGMLGRGRAQGWIARGLPVEAVSE